MISIIDLFYKQYVIDRQRHTTTLKKKTIFIAPTAENQRPFEHKPRTCLCLMITNSVLVLITLAIFYFVSMFLIVKTKHVDCLKLVNMCLITLFVVHKNFTLCIRQGFGFDSNNLKDRSVFIRTLVYL